MTYIRDGNLKPDKLGIYDTVFLICFICKKFNNKNKYPYDKNNQNLLILCISITSIGNFVFQYSDDELFSQLNVTKLFDSSFIIWSNS